MDFDITLSQERVQQVTTVGVSHINAALTELRRLFLVEDLVDSIKFGVLLYCLTYVGAIFNGMTLIILGKFSSHWIAVKKVLLNLNSCTFVYLSPFFSLFSGYIALFSLPKVYEANKTVIDAQLDVVRSKISEVTEK